MATLNDLRAAIAQLLGLPTVPNVLQLNSNTRERAFECYVFALVLHAIRQAGGTVELLREPVIRRKRRMTRTVAGDETEPEQTDDAATEAPTEQGQ